MSSHPPPGWGGTPGARPAAVGAGGPLPVRQTAPVDISARVDYAVRAMLILADADAEASPPTSIETLSTRQDLPKKFLEAIFADLRRAGLVASRRGARGGYVLASPRDRISIGDVFRAVDGPLAEVRGLRPSETEYDGVARHLPDLWVAVRASLREVLDETSLEDLRTGALPDRVRQLLDAPDAWANR
ncbi:BadM/Rrf2 family transcriptional regulator [Terracoccus luteus]|jgi:Rrf2 family protein|uniref:BadM/Rrf2 family transcriptional regulator n=1 Tax=Terracoccus luteus TaxID=53356 RepID=A0A495XXS1_9MICO|nr:BadM/Rrf2 family transcriptional regulator [Terracoccus luteus]